VFLRRTAPRPATVTPTVPRIINSAQRRQVEAGGQHDRRCPAGTSSKALSAAKPRRPRTSATKREGRNPPEGASWRAARARRQHQPTPGGVGLIETAFIAGLTDCDDGDDGVAGGAELNSRGHPTSRS
jgi:hypothetical protein